MKPCTLEKTRIKIHAKLGTLTVDKLVQLHRIAALLHSVIRKMHNPNINLTGTWHIYVGMKNNAHIRIGSIGVSEILNHAGQNWYAAEDSDTYNRQIKYIKY